MGITKKAISVGVSAALLASLVATVVAPATAFASTAVVSAGTIPVGGTSTAPATFTFCENAGGNWHSGGTISVTLTDANSVAGTLTFTNSTGGAAAPTIPLNPGGLGGVTIVSVIGGVVTVNVPTDDGVNTLCFSIGNLYITASSTAAAGAINATAGGTISASTYASTYTSAAGLVAVSEPAGYTGPLLVTVTSSCGFVNVNTATSTSSGTVYAGDFIIGGTDTGAAGTSSQGASSVVPSTGQESLSGLVSAPVMTAGVTTVTQTNVPSCSANALTSPGTVGAAVEQTVSATPNLSPGENNQLAGNTSIAESAAGVIAASTILTFSISSPTSGVTFSTSPTATSSASAATSSVVAPGTPTYSMVAPVAAVSGGTMTAGTYDFEVTAVDGVPLETLPSSPVAVTLTALGKVNLTWSASFGSASFNVYGKTASGTTYALIASTTSTSYTVNTLPAAWTTPPPTASTSAVAAPTGLAGTAVPNTPGTTYATSGGTYYFEVAANGSVSGQTVASSPVTVTWIAGDALALSWNAVAGASTYTLFEASSLVGPFVNVTNAAFSGTSATLTADATVGTTAPLSVGNAIGSATSGGLLFSNGTNTSLCTLNYGAQSCSVTIGPAVSTVPTTITLSNILLDIASTVPAGTSVDITVTGSPAVLVYVSDNTVAYVGRTIASVGAQPTIYIGFNGQNSGMITLNEAGSGFFQASGANDAFGICINTGESFTYTPWAIVSTGNLLLLNTSTSAGVASVAGSLSTINDKSCATWSIYSASTTASTVNIVGSTASGALAVGATNGPTLSVPANLTPGTTQMDVLVGAQGHVAADNATALTTIASNATRVYKSGVTVTALSQPFIAAGATQAAGGNLQLSETLHGQFLAGEAICVAVLPRSTNDFVQDTTFNTSNTNLQPVIATNYGTTGLLASTVGTPGCQLQVVDSSVPSDFGPIGLNTANSFYFTVSQQATGGLGQITISNINFTTAADAPNGPVQVVVFSLNSTALNQSGGVAFQQTVSNATVGAGLTKVVLSADSSLSASGPFSTATKVLAKGKSITIRIRSNPQLAGTKLGVWIAKKSSKGTWSKFSPHASVITDVTGTAYYTYTFTSSAWLSFRFYYGGSATNAPAWSYPSQFGRAL